MRVTAKGWAVAVGVVMMAVGCGAPPDDDIAAARAALQKATAERAGQYAGESMKAAQDAQAALDAELKAQADQWLKSYERIRCGRGEGKGRGCGGQGEGRRRRAGQNGPGREARGSRRGQHPTPHQNQRRRPGLPSDCALGTCHRRCDGRGDDWRGRKSR